MSESLPIRPDLRRTAPAADSVSGLSIGEYLIRRLQDYGIGHVFGIPGDYVLGSTRCWKRARSASSAARARTAPALRPTPTPGCTAWAPSA